MVTHITRITITCPRCAQWHNPAPLFGGYYYSCDSAAGLWQAKPGLCPPCVDITYDELLQHYIISYWPFGVTQPILYYTLTWDETPLPGGGTDITFDPIDPE